MSNTFGHNHGCSPNCGVCGKGKWRRLENKQMRRQDKAEIDYELEADGWEHYIQDPRDKDYMCAHGGFGYDSLLWCDDCFACPSCGGWHTHTADCIHVWPEEAWTTYNYEMNGS